ncbi:D-alanyl-D-alanine carboxypeptidase [Actinacidiphila rubida]|uniref:D-alanyl-D-alanine carboxypeptidase n=1 Tax=Actinacidiphila rubida TaxID=310780 RepID=A0A1H8NAG1_9ACTN|nr:serine hydrolase domain-containing protein [Actinacidiphila rubida]SEO26681.1 D-alanyl-D-alanine carboxypeptidase [Actinacidiphila rubida]
MGAAAGRRGLVVAWAVALATTALAAVPATAGTGTGPGDRPRADGGYSAADLRGDLAAVKAAGGGDVNVVAAYDRAGRAPVTARTSAALPRDPEFRIASTSKTFTAVVLLQLAAEKRLSLDDTVDHWLPGVVAGHGNDGTRITLRDLLRHTSGLYDYVADPGIQDKLVRHFEENRYDDTSARDLVAVAMRHAPLFTPGVGPRRWAYSNTDYLVAAMAAEKAAGQSWQEMVEHRVIAPLGLRHTYIPGANPFLVGPHVPVTIDGPDGRPVDLTEESFQHTADSGVVSTPSDLNAFFRALAGGRLLPAAQWREMRETVPYDDLPVPPAGRQGGYGLGLRVVPLTCGGVYYMHEGDGWGVYGRPAVSADGRRAVTVSITTTTALVDQDKVDRAVESLTDRALCDRA